MTEQALALSLPEIEEVTLEQVLLRTAGEAGEDGHQEYELLVPARAAQTMAELRQMASGEEMLRLARGVIVDQKWLRLLSVSTEYCGAAPSLYRVRARERSDASSQG